MVSKRKILLSFILIAVLGALFFLVANTITKLQHQKQVAGQLKTIPYLPVTTIGSDKDWNGASGPVIIIFFNSGCEHCQNEAGAIQQNLSAFAETNLWFVSDEAEEKIAAFSREFQLDAKENVWWLKMQPEDVYKTFGPIMVPHIWIYSKDGQLVKEFKGETKVEAILAWL